MPRTYIFEECADRPTGRPPAVTCGHARAASQADTITTPDIGKRRGPSTEPERRPAPQTGTWEGCADRRTRRERENGLLGGCYRALVRRIPPVIRRTGLSAAYRSSLAQRALSRLAEGFHHVHLGIDAPPVTSRQRCVRRPREPKRWAVRNVVRARPGPIRAVLPAG